MIRLEMTPLDPADPAPDCEGVMKLTGLEEALNGLLEDWGWWARQRTSQGYRCLSAEGRYRPPRVEDQAAPPRPIDEAICCEIEREVTHPDFPKLAHRLLKGWYVRRDSPGHIGAACAVPRDLVTSRVVWAALILRNRLKNSLDR